MSASRAIQMTFEQFEDSLKDKRILPSSLLTAWGETKTFERWLRDRRTIVNKRTARERLESGWQIEDALTTPTQDYKKKAHWTEDPNKVVNHQAGLAFFNEFCDNGGSLKFLINRTADDA